jgi:nucleoid-associated protein YgaU
MTYPFILPPPSWVPGPHKATPPPAPNGPGVVTPHVARWHIVESGETLWGIAQRFYKNPSDWVRIFNANRDGVTRPDNTVGSLTNNTVLPGERLHIP